MWMIFFKLRPGKWRVSATMAMKKERERHFANFRRLMKIGVAKKNRTWLRTRARAIDFAGPGYGRKIRAENTGRKNGSRTENTDREEYGPRSECAPGRVCAGPSVRRRRAVSRTEQRDVIGGARDGVGDVEQEEAEGEERRHPDVHLLRRRAEEDGEEDGRREDARQDDVHDVERVLALQRDGERDEREALVGVVGEVELGATQRRVQHQPLAVRLVRVEVHRVSRRRQVHLGRVVRPGAERQVALLLVERVVGDVDLTHGAEHAARLPAQRAVRLEHDEELVVRLVDRLRPTHTHALTVVDRLRPTHTHTLTVVDRLHHAHTHALTVVDRLRPAHTHTHAHCCRSPPPCTHTHTLTVVDRLRPTNTYAHCCRSPPSCTPTHAHCCRSHPPYTHTRAHCCRSPAPCTHTHTRSLL